MRTKQWSAGKLLHGETVFAQSAVSKQYSLAERRRQSIVCVYQAVKIFDVLFVVNDKVGYAVIFRF